MAILSSNQSNLILTLHKCSITDIIWNFISFLCCCRLSEHDGAQQACKLLLLWTLCTNELNVFYFNDYLSATFFFLPVYNLCKCLMWGKIKKKEKKRIKRVCRGDVSGWWRCKARWQTLLTSSTSLLLLLLNLIGCQSEMELQEKLKARKQKAFYWVVQCMKIIVQSKW